MSESTSQKPTVEDVGTKEASGGRTEGATEGVGSNLSDLELKKYELEKYKAESAARLEIRRYALERYKANREQRFINRNLGVLISAAISLSAVLVSLGQVWVAKISKDKEMEVALLQKQAENERLDRQRNKELIMQAAEQERQWNLSRAKFITDYRKILFEGRPEELKRMSLLIETLFPPNIAVAMFEDFKSTATSSEAQTVWNTAQERIQKRVRANPNLAQQPRLNTPPLQVPLDGSVNTESTSNSLGAPQSSVDGQSDSSLINQEPNAKVANCGGGRTVSCNAYKCICKPNVGCTGYDVNGTPVEEHLCPAS
jgi:hypothetical protein